MPSRSSATVVAAVLLLSASAAAAATTDIATDPLARSQSSSVKPNVMLIVDDSGSMGWRHMPDYVNDTNVDKPRCSDSTCSSTTSTGVEGNPPWYASGFNRLYYDPQVTYSPAVDATGASMPSYGAPWTAVPVNAYETPSATINLASAYPELVYCKNANDDPSSANCRRNGIDTANPFLYNTASAANGYPDSTASGGYRFPVTRLGSPYYFDIVPVEYCSDERLTSCVLASAPSAAYPYPAPVRFCQSASDASSASAVSGNVGGSPRCQEKYDSAHTRPRYGKFQRVDIKPTVSTYGNRPNRTDCAARPVCTYAEEMTNFANWYAYYSTRLQTMKTGVGQAFKSIDGRYRVGAITISPGTRVKGSNYVPIDTFDGMQRVDWYKTFYKMAPSGYTPLREALSRVGRHFAGITSGINDGMNEDPVQYSCQPNIALLTTDGYWNNNAGQRLDGSPIGNVDNVDSGYSTRAYGAYDGGSATNASDTLADVALYYYQTDLRPAGAKGALGTDVSANNVPTTTKDTNPAQHMVTFTVGLGVDGIMKYRPDYETATVGDFYNIKSGNNTCPWTNGTCNWPKPAANSPTAIDDLWHAAVNGRGRYVNAQDARSLYQGIASALAEIKTVTGAAAASATSSPNVSSTDNAIFSSTYRTVKWDGELVKQSIDIITGKVLPTVVWSAATQLNAAVGPASDSRTIYTNVGGALKPFAYADLDAGARAYFDNQCAKLSHCASLAASDAAIANSGTALVNYLRGQRGNENGAFRLREFVLGDLVGSRPAFVREPRRNYGDGVTPSYFDFKNANKSRQAVIYVGGNDGMLHAFDAATGAELWAFVPRTVLPRLHRLADKAYGNAHEFFADGTPAIADAYFGGTWHTVLVAGFNAGGRGYYALDVTVPTAPKLLWEICADSALCVNSEPNLGLSFGNPVVTKRASDGKWVALLTSGYNNVTPGDGQGWLFVVDLATGSVLNRVSTGVGSTATPSGFARISAYANNPDTDNTSTYVYGGDLQGNVWRFDLSQSPPALLKMATLRDAAGKPQPVTTRPELGQINGQRIVYVGTGRYLGVTDLADPATLTPPGGWSYLSAIYALKDSGTSLGDPRATGKLVAQTISTLNATQRTVTSNAVDWGLKDGWVADFPTPGERVNLDPQLVLGTLVVTTNIPDQDACTAGGTSWIYQFDARTGSAVSSAGAVVGELRSDTLTVGNTVVRLPDGSMKLITTGASGQKDTLALRIGAGSTSARRISWRELAR
ncbi:MAG: PilC/PilY family type IV pilus protein [Pseudomonadota bacterium]